MPYTITFQSCNLRLTDNTGPVNPRSATTSQRADLLGLSAEEKQAVVSVLQRYSVRRLGIDDRIQLRLRSGGPAAVNLVGLYTGKPCVRGTVTADDLTPHLLSLAFEIAQAGNMLFTPEGVPYPFVVSEQLRAKMCIPYPRVRSVFAPGILWKILRPAPPEEPTKEQPAADESKSADPPAE